MQLVNEVGWKEQKRDEWSFRFTVTTVRKMWLSWKQRDLFSFSFCCHFPGEFSGSLDGSIHMMIVNTFFADIRCPQRLNPPYVSLQCVFRAPAFWFKVKYLNNCLYVGSEIWYRSPEDEFCCL